VTWLYVPETSCLSVPVSEDLNSALPLPCTPAERLHAASVTWRGKPQQPQVWSRRWARGGFILHLSGLTCSPSMLAHGVGSFISSLRAIPAKTTPSPETAPGLKESGSSHQRSFASPTSAGLIVSSARTCRGTQTDSLRPSSRHWSDWATALRQEYSVRPKPEIPCGASDCSSWPSASVMDTGDATDLEKIQARREKHKARGINGNGFGKSLAEASRTWPGPATLDSTNTRNSTANRSNPNSTHSIGDTLCDAVTKWAAPTTSDTNGAGQHGDGGLDLRTQADQWMGPNVPNGGPNQRGTKGDVPLPGQAAQWPGPQARDFHGVNRASPLDHNARPLNEVAALFHPPSSPDQPIAGGSMSSTAGPSSNQPSAKRKLNPIFVEALMRWPTGLSGFERPETAWTRWWLLMPSFVSALCTQKPAAQGNLF
jgi:hypothetical protein